jgi:hypothetical protein
MSLRYYKTIEGSAANAAYLVVKQQSEIMKQQAKQFAELFDGEPLFSTSMTGREFAGIQLNNFENRPDNHLWTKPTSQNGGVSRPRAKPLCAAHKKEQEALNNRYMQNTPAIKEASFKPLFESLGSDWGQMLFCGISFFEHERILYISTKAELANCTEILASEYLAADIARELITN